LGVGGDFSAGGVGGEESTISNSSLSRSKRISGWKKTMRAIHEEKQQNFNSNSAIIVWHKCVWHKCDIWAYL